MHSSEAPTPRLDPARDARGAVLIAAGGLALFTVFMAAIAWAGWLRMRWVPVLSILGSLVALNLLLSLTTHRWARYRMSAWIYEGVHAVAFAALLHNAGGLQMGIGFLVFAFLVVHTEILHAKASPFVTANVSAFAYAGLAIAETGGFVVPVGGPEARLPGTEAYVIVAFGFLSLNFLALYADRSGHQLRTFASRLKEMVRERTKELRLQTRELEHLNAELTRRVDEKVAEIARMAALKRYLPAPLVDEVMEGRLSVSGAHDRVRLAVLVVTFRVRGTEHSPEDTAAAVNAVLERCLAEAHDRGGVVDRLTPTGVSMLFGAPVRRPLGECAEAAAETARAILTAVGDAEEELAVEGVAARLELCAGLTAGVATVGNFGSTNRLEYMAIGGVVEQAWSLAHGGDGQLCVDEAVRALLPSIAGADTLVLRSNRHGTATFGTSQVAFVEGTRTAERSSRTRSNEGPLAIGDRVDGRYEVLSVLGTGAMGVVYRVRHVELTCLRALKVIYPHLLSNPEAVRRLRLEAEVLSRMSHPHVVRFYDFARDRRGERYLAMELVDGPTLGRLIGGRPMPLSQIRVLADQVLQALEVAHEAGIVHRDLKPANVLVSQGLGTPQVAKVADFGLARLITGAESASAYGALGTPAYMSPEQCRGESGDERADLYSFGAILFEMLTAERPFHSENIEGWFAAHLHDPAPDPRERHPVPESWAHLVKRALEKDPARRFQSAAEMRETLRTTCFDRLHREDGAPRTGEVPRREASRPTPPAAGRATPALGRAEESGTDTLGPDPRERTREVVAAQPEPLEAMSAKGA